MNLTVILQLIQAVAPILMKLAESANNGDFKQMQMMVFYNEQTKAKVAAFQKQHGLLEDGIVGDKTWSKVEELISHSSG